MPGPDHVPCRLSTHAAFNAFDHAGRHLVLFERGQNAGLGFVGHKFVALDKGDKAGATVGIEGKKLGFFRRFGAVGANGADANSCAQKRRAFGHDFAVAQPSGANQNGGQEFVPNVLGDPGTIDVEVNYDPSDPPPLGVLETITLTFKLASGDSTAATVSGQGFITSKSVAVPVKDSMVSASLSIKLSGVWTNTPAT